MTSSITGLNSVKRKRQQPTTTSLSSWQTCKVFSNATKKWLPIPEFINMYNCFIKGVNTANQIRSYYTSLKIHCCTQKALFYFLLNTTVTNAYKLSSYTTRGWLNYTSYKAFREDLVNALFKHSTQLPQQYKSSVSMDKIIQYLVVEHRYKPKRINKTAVIYTACL